MENDFTIGKQR
jgi:hypothetical protein